MSDLKQTKTELDFRGILRVAGQWIYRLRKVFISIPIVWAAVYLARLNWNTLPDTVGLGLQNSGEFLYYVTKEAAVFGSLAVTAVCLLMLFLSRRTLYPWLVCLFSMGVPIIIMVINIFPS